MQIYLIENSSSAQSTDAILLFCFVGQDGRRQNTFQYRSVYTISEKQLIKLQGTRISFIYGHHLTHGVKLTKLESYIGFEAAVN